MKSSDRQSFLPLKHFDSQRAFRDAAAIYRHARWCTSRECMKAARVIVDRLKKAGLRNAKIVRLPADGTTFYGGWVMPKAWDVRSATLEVVEPRIRGAVLADYQRDPLSLMMWSPPTPAEGITAEVVTIPKLSKSSKFKGNLIGKIVLLDARNQPYPSIVATMAKKGAVAIVSDFVKKDSGVREAKDVEDATQYNNYCNPMWDGAARLPAFTITPRRGRLLRQLLEKHDVVRLRAKVDSRLYNGVLPLVTASLPGEDEQEIVLTAHMDEPGASDNASGVALSMEVLRALADHVKKRGRPLKRTVRVMFSVEVRGIQAYINTGRYTAPILAGLNIDMVGANHQKARSGLDLQSARPTSPSYLEEMLRELASKESKRPPLFRWNMTPELVVDDCQFATYPFSTPMCFVGQVHERTYHTSLDTPKAISAAHMKRIGRMICTTVEFFADADHDEILKRAGAVYKRAAAGIRSKRMSKDDAIEWAHTCWSDLEDLLPVAPSFPQDDQKGLFPVEAFIKRCAAWETKLSALAGKRSAAKRTPTRRLTETYARKAADMVPLKLFAGYLGWEDLSKQQKKQLKLTTGLIAGWGTTEWLQTALDFSNGTRSVLDIHGMILADGLRISLPKLVEALEFLAGVGRIDFRNTLDKSDILRAVRRAGVRAGDVVVAHTALSNFGYVKGGPDTIIDALLTAVGKKGTLVVPTHSLNWMGRPPYDPNTSPSRVGAVTNAFLQRRQTIRSLHPTHSVAAIGPLAEKLTAGHDHTVAPQGREGFWGAFYEANGRVLLMGPLESNTILHAADVWAGMPYPPARAHVIQRGRKRKVTIPGMPWHVGHFDRVHRALKKKNLIRSAKLGEGTIYSMRARDAVDTGMRMVRRNPGMVTPRGCNCSFCRYVRTHR